MKQLLANLRIRTRLWLGFGLLISIVAIQSISVLWNLGSVRDSVDGVVRHIQPAVLDAMSLDKYLDAANKSLGFYLLSQEPLHRQSYLDNLEQIDTVLERMQESSLAKEDQQVAKSLKALATQIAEFSGMQEVLLPLADDPMINQPGLAYAAENLNPLAQDIGQQIGQMIFAERSERVNEERRALLILLGDIRHSWSSITTSVRAYLAFRSDGLRNEIETQQATLDGQLEELNRSQHLLSLEQEDALSQFKHAYQLYFSNLPELYAIHGGAHWRTDARLIRTDLGDNLQVIRSELDELLRYLREMIDSQSNGMLLQAEATRVVVIILALLALLMALGQAHITAQSLIGRINGLIGSVKQVAKGNLTAEIAIEGEDELADLAHAATEMRNHLNDLVLRLTQNAHSVHSAAQQISEAVSSQAATSSEMSSSVAEITSTMEELSASSTQIAEHSKSVVDISNTTFENAKRGSESMQLVMNKMGDIQHDNQSSLNDILELGSKSKEISKVMEIINAVADQTKLIAFNAALEAASAGESGRRFGVVAAEIRRLADSVTDSTGEIEGKIGQIQDAISRLVITSEKGANGIASGIDATEHTATRLEDLVDAASQTSSASQQISLSTQQQKTASNQVVLALREIVTASSNTANSISRISDISHEMNQLSSELDTLVNRFKIKE